MDEIEIKVEIKIEIEVEIKFEVKTGFVLTKLTNTLTLVRPDGYIPIVGGEATAGM
jgi:hypothetical protein